MKHPMKYLGTYPSNWAGYVYKEKLGYTTGVHTGTDYNHGTDDLGDPVYAVASGKVVDRILDGQVRGFGNAITIETDGTPPGVKGNKLYHRYLHLNTVHVRKGQNVKVGQKIATVGTTGGVPAHLHLDTWTDRNGLGAHRRYHKNTQLASYEDPYLLIKNNPTWDGGEEVMDTNAKVQSMYNLLRGRKATSAEVRGWKGKTYQEFAESAHTKEEVKNRTSRLNRLEKQVSQLSNKLDSVESKLEERTESLSKAQKELETTVGRLNDKTSELNDQIDLYDALKKEHKVLKGALAKAEKYVTKLEKENAQLSLELGEQGELTAWQHFQLFVKKLFNL